MKTNRAPRTVTHLVPAQSLYVLGMSVDLALTALAGDRLAPSRTLATVPFALMPLVAAVATFAISRAVGRFGYRRTLAAAPLGAVVGATLCAIALYVESFAIFCLGTGLVGIYQAGAGYYRYVAAESWPQQRARAVSTLLTGGLVAAIVAPLLASWLADALPVTYAAPYVLAALAALCAALWNLRMPGNVEATATAPTPTHGRSRRELWTRPVLLLGVLAAAVAAASMTIMMTAAPLAGHDMGYTSTIAALAMQGHLVGMFAPGFVVARWIGRIGSERVAGVGVLMLAVAGAFALLSHGTIAYMSAMAAVGVGWNFANSGGSAMIASSYRDGERARVQPIAESTVIGVQVVAALGAGALATASGWSHIGVGIVVVALAAAIAFAARAVRVPSLAHS